MTFPDLFKLEKLTLYAFPDRSRRRTPGTPKFVAMFNPTTLVQTFGIDYVPACADDGNAGEARFVRRAPADLSVSLLLDGTGVDRIGLAPAGETVGERIAAFLALVYRINGKTREPSFLWLKWGKWGTELGDAGFNCRLKSVAITYQSFDRDGSPLRAELALVLVADDELDKQQRAAGPSSPDVPQGQMVRAGDTLPALTRKAYGSPRHVAAVARANNLDQLRALPVGRALVFPPVGA